MSKTVVMVLAGGRGTRLGILCQERPKPLLPLVGRFTVIDFALSNAANSGLRQMAVLVDYQRHLLKDYLWNGAPWLPGPGGSLEVLEPRAGSYLGTADAVHQNLAFIEASHADLVLVLAADHVYQMDYRKIIAHHECTGADVTVAVTPVPLDKARRFGLVGINSSGQIASFEEKPLQPRSDLASMGIYVFGKEALTRYLREDASDHPSAHDFGRSIIPAIVQKGRAFGYKFHGYWQDIGEVDSYYHANFELASRPDILCRDGDWPIFTNEETPSLAPLELHVRSSFVEPARSVPGRVENSILSRGTRIEPEAVVRDSVLMANCVVGRHSVIDRCILDEGVVIGESCYVGLGPRLGGDGADITVVGKAVAVPPHTAIGRSSKVWPGVAISDFRTKVVPPDTVLTHAVTSVGAVVAPAFG